MRRLLKGWIVVSFQLVVLMTLTKPPSYRGRTVPASGFKGPSDGGAVPAPPSGALPSARTPAAPVEPAPPAAAPPAVPEAPAAPPFAPVASAPPAPLVPAAPLAPAAPLVPATPLPAAPPFVAPGAFALPHAASTSNAGSSLDRDRMDRWLFFMGLLSRRRHDRLPGVIGADLLSVQELRVHPVDDLDALDVHEDVGVLLVEPDDVTRGAELDHLDAVMAAGTDGALPVGGDQIAVGQDLELGEAIGVEHRRVGHRLRAEALRHQVGVAIDDVQRRPEERREQHVAVGHEQRLPDVTPLGAGRGPQDLPLGVAFEELRVRRHEEGVVACRTHHAHVAEARVADRAADPVGLVEEGHVDLPQPALAQHRLAVRHAVRRRRVGEALHRLHELPGRQVEDLV